MGIPVGYGLPGWLDTAPYLSADETRALGSYTIGTRHRCAFSGCDHWPIEAAHVARKGIGGRRGKHDAVPHDGPQVLVCSVHHSHTDTHPRECCFAIRRSDLMCGYLTVAGDFTMLGQAHEGGVGMIFPEATITGRD